MPSAFCRLLGPLGRGPPAHLLSNGLPPVHVHDLWIAPGALHLVTCAWCLVPCTWCLAPNALRLFSVPQGGGSPAYWLSNG